MKQPKILATFLDKHGYENIKLCKNNKTYHKSIHRLVAEHFISNPNNLPMVDHINKVRNDNRVENLQWIDRKGNLERSFETMSPVRNFNQCELFNSNNILLGRYQSVKEACRYCAKEYGARFSGLYRNLKSKGYYIKKIDNKSNFNRCID